MNNPIKIGVLGCANIAQRLVIPSILQTPNFELVAVASRNASKAADYAKRFNCEAIEGYENMVSRTDIDAVYIPLPIGMHEEWAIKCLESGKHVLSEKSLTINLASAKKMVAAARANNKLLLENFMFKYHSQHDFVFEHIKKGTIGEVRCIRSTFGFPPFRDKDNIRYQKQLGGGALLDAGAYTLKVSQMFLGNNLEVRGAYAKQDEALGVDLHGGALLANADGVISEAAWGFDNYYQCSYEVWGSKGKIIVERAYTAPPGFKPKIIIEQQDQKLEYLVAADNHFVKTLNYFYQSIQENKLEDNYSELLQQAQLMEAVAKAANIS